MNNMERLKRQENIRNFYHCSYDHGKSSLADRLLENTRSVEGRDEKLLDSMDIEENGNYNKAERCTFKIYG